jgi:hypothetical protein
MFCQRNRFSILLLISLVFSLLALPLAAGAATPSNGISSPANGAALSGTVEVKGYASDPNFQKWQLDLLPGGNSNAAVFLAFGTTAGDFTYTLDTATLPKGEHALRLRVVRTNSNYSEYITKFTIGAAAAAAPAAPAAVTATRPVTPTVTATRPVTPTVAAATPVTPTRSVAAPVNGISGPAAGATLSGTVTVKGYANDPRFQKWQLDLLPGDNAFVASFLALGVTAGDFTHTLDTTALPKGNYVLRLRVVRTDSNYTEYITKFTIGAAAAAAPAAPAAPIATRPVTPTVTAATPVTPTKSIAAPVNGISSPANGATLSGTVTVKGYASDPNFQKWQLDLLPGDNPNAAAFLAFGTAAGDFTYTLDATGLPKGNQALRLRIVRKDSNYSEYITKFTR